MTPTSDVTATASPSDTASGGRDPASTAIPAWGRRMIVAFVLALASLLLLYLAINVPGAWFPSAQLLQWSARDVAVTRGTGTLVQNELVITATDANNSAVLSLTANFRASDYPGIAWWAIDVPDTADVRLLWRNDYSPQKLNYAQVRVESGRLLPVDVHADPAWIGRVTGLALVMRATLAQPIRVFGVVAKPMGALELLGERAREWVALERWTGTSINTLAGGADIQGLPLPLLLGGVVALAGAGLWVLVRHRQQATIAAWAAMLATIFVFAWFLLDARWMINLARQAQVTSAQFGDKDSRGKHLVAEDAALYAFIEKARAALPPERVRIFVASDANYFRSRAAYHLYPNNVYADARRNVLPAPEQLRSGDWIVVYQRRGIQYDPAQQQLRWDGLTPVPAELKMTDAGAAVFRIK